MFFFFSTQEQDQILADTVLRHIESGSTQLKAFEDSGERLFRTASACGFRWNAIVRKQYKYEIEEAKRRRNQPLKDNPLDYQIKQINPPEVLTFQMVIERVRELGEVEKYNKILKKENINLLSECKSLQSKLLSLQKDYDSILRIIDRARQMSHKDN